MEKFDKENLETLRIEITEALNEITKKHGLKELKLGGITYLDTEFSVKISGLAISGLTEHERNMENREMLAERYGLPKDIFQFEFMNDSKRMIPYYIDMKAKKYPVICKDLDTERLYKFTIEMMKNKIRLAEFRKGKTRIKA